MALQGQFDEAFAYFSRALQIDPLYEDAYLELGKVLERQGKIFDAANHYSYALRLNPNSIEALSHQALLLATHKDLEMQNPNGALNYAEKAVGLSQGSDAFSLHALAVVYAKLGRFPEAIKAAEIAFASASESGDKELATTLESSLKLYQAGRALDEGKP